MHYGNLVIVKRPKDAEAAKLWSLEDAVQEAMGPSEESGGFWDWYQIGGRWTGTFDGYDPNTDPNNLIGKRVSWPTDWKLHEGDVMPVAQLTAEHLTKFYRVVLPDGYGHYESERYVPWAGDGEEKFPKQSMPTLEWIMKLFGQPEGDGDGNDYLAVVVDNHS